MKPQDDSPRLMRMPEVLKLTGLSHASIYRTPTFPKPVRIGERASAWVAAEVCEWIEARIKQRDVGDKPRDPNADQATERRLAKLARMTPEERAAANKARMAKLLAKRGRAAA